MCRLPNIEVMGFDPSMFLLQHRIKLVTPKLRIKIMSLSYYPLRLADVSICAIAVHRGLALPVHPVPLRHGFELLGRPIAAEPVLRLIILNQSINPTLKVLLLGQIDPVDLGELHIPLQHMCVKRITFACQSKKSINSTPACKIEVNSPACSRRQQICNGHV
jgi:hypothetical protein